MSVCPKGMIIIEAKKCTVPLSLHASRLSPKGRFIIAAQKRYSTSIIARIMLASQREVLIIEAKTRYSTRIASCLCPKGVHYRRQNKVQYPYRIMPVSQRGSLLRPKQGTAPLSLRASYLCTKYPKGRSQLRPQKGTVPLSLHASCLCPKARLIIEATKGRNIVAHITSVSQREILWLATYLVHPRKWLPHPLYETARTIPNPDPNPIKRRQENGWHCVVAFVSCTGCDNRCVK